MACGNCRGGEKCGRGRQTDDPSKLFPDFMKSARAPGVEHVTKVPLVARTLMMGKVIDPPKLKLSSQKGHPCEAIVKGQSWDWTRPWKHFAEGKKVEKWGLVNLSSNVIETDFIKDLRCRSGNLGMDMGEPEFTIKCSDGTSNMDAFSSVAKMRQLLQSVGEYGKGLQFIIFIRTEKDDSYWYLKWILETQIGLISQFCLEKYYSSTTDKTKLGFLDNLCMKINEKIGGSNVELIKQPLPHGSAGENVMMFIGAGVNHPEAKDKTSPSIAAVVGTVNWPAANRYVARIETQKHRSERIVNFGAICKDLVNTFYKFNKVIPDQIVVFRDCVGHEGRKLDMVVNRELRDLEEVLSTYDYKPNVTFILVRERHHTQIFRHKGRGQIDTVLPAGTVVDTFTFNQSTDLDFYLCGSYTEERLNSGSKPIRYRVLRDENSFPSHDLQKLIYHLCFPHARSAKPVSLVVPVHYANLAATRGRGYYRGAKLSNEESDALTSLSLFSGNSSVMAENYCRVHPNIENEMFFV